MKTCSKCGEVKLLSAFSNAGTKDGLFPWCRMCKAQYDSERYSKDSGTRSPTYIRKHPEISRASSARYGAKHPERVYARNEARRARKLAAPGRGVTSDEWLEILAAADGICAYCDQPGKLTMDHIVPLILGGAHDIDNIAAACGPCNSSKGARPLAEFLQRMAA